MTSSSVVPVNAGFSSVALYERSTPTQTLPPPLRKRLRSPVRTGNALILVFVGGFGVWASMAPLASGAMAPGIIATDSGRRVVQHLEGGIIRSIVARDGDVVTEGQTLMRLEPLTASANYAALIAQRNSLVAQKARLDAEKAGSPDVNFPSELIVDGKPIALATAQQGIFQARRGAREAKFALLRERIDQLSEQIKGFEVQSKNIDTQLSYIHEEIASKDSLLEKGLLQRPEALRLKRNESELLAQKASFETEIGKSRQQIEETNLQIHSEQANRLEEIAAESDKIELALVDLNERIKASEDVLGRTQIVAPVAGVVINSRFKTEGGVVQRGEPILEIVPRSKTMTIEAHVGPNDIPRIHAGQPVKIHLAAYSSRTVPRVDGIVRSVSPDRVADQSGLQAYYLARVEIDKEALGKLPPNVSLLPGMSVDITFLSESRTLLDYLLSPFVEVFRRGLREQ